MEMFNQQELLIARSIINGGLKRAAESLSFFMKESIELEEVDLNEIDSLHKGSFSLKYSSGSSLLITHIIGDLEGICCLLFSKEEANLLQKTVLPKEIQDNPVMFEEMKEAILLEIDNIIAAAVITEFSNLLQQKMYGGVPELVVVNEPELEHFIKTKVEEVYAINFKTRFNTQNNKSFSPMFIWFMNESFIAAIKNYSMNLETKGN